MTDEITTPLPAEGATPATPESSPKKQGFFSTPLGRVVMILGALGALAVIAGIVVAVVLFVLFPTEADLEVRVPERQQQPAAGGAETTSGAAPAQAAAVVSNDEVFTFRDIFEPLITAEDASSTPEASPDSTSAPDATEYAADTLYLVSVTTTGDEPEANMVWDQQEYTLSEGDAIPDSPWKLLEIRDDSVVMLFGDQQVILTVGQGIQK
ncbi:MAG: hypothetical protein WBI63_09030 [Coriobacteriia bacterium]